MIKRYQNDFFTNLWSDETKFTTWLEVEINALEVLANNNIIPMEEFLKIKTNAKFDVNRVMELDAILHHDVIAFTRAVSENLGQEARFVHYGLTSTDIVDTALNMNIKKANDEIYSKIIAFSEVLKKQALEHKDTLCIGRTHGVHADVTTFGMKFALYYDEMQRNIERFNLARRDIEVCKLSGAVGTAAFLDPSIIDEVSEKCGLTSVNIATQVVSRDNHAFYMATLVMIGNTIEKVATEIRHLQRTEVREVFEFFDKNQKGSSAMPHKKNPVSCENLCGLSRVLRGYLTTANENVALWHERDISHSSTERIILADATSLIDYMLTRMTRVVDNIIVEKETMLKNLNSTNNVIFSQQLLNKLVMTELTREKAYDTIQPCALKSFEENIDFKELVKPHLLPYLSEEEFENCFKIENQLRNIDTIYKQVGLL